MRISFSGIWRWNKESIASEENTFGVALYREKEKKRVITINKRHVKRSKNFWWKISFAQKILLVKTPKINVLFFSPRKEICVFFLRETTPHPLLSSSLCFHSLHPQLLLFLVRRDANYLLRNSEYWSDVGWKKEEIWLLTFESIKSSGIGSLAT